MSVKTLSDGELPSMNEMSVSDLEKLEQIKWDTFDKLDDGTNVTHSLIDEKRKEVMADIREIDSELLKRGVR